MSSAPTFSVCDLVPPQQPFYVHNCLDRPRLIMGPFKDGITNIGGGLVVRHLRKSLNGNVDGHRLVLRTVGHEWHCLRYVWPRKNCEHWYVAIMLDVHALHLNACVPYKRESVRAWRRDWLNELISVARQLHHWHAKCVLHGDVHAENICNGVLVQYSAARSAGSKFGVMSHRRARYTMHSAGDTADVRLDCYALAVTAAVVLLGLDESTLPAERRATAADVAEWIARTGRTEFEVVITKLLRPDATALTQLHALRRCDSEK